MVTRLMVDLRTPPYQSQQLLLQCRHVQQFDFTRIQQRFQVFKELRRCLGR
jgi:hypothetical protein